MSYTSFRQAVAEAIASALVIDQVVDGRVEGPLERLHLVCSWPLGVRESDDSVDVEEIEVAVRALRPFQQQTDPSSPIDPAVLEDWAATIRGATHQVQTTSGPWYWRPVETEIDVGTQAVTARIIGWQFNLFEQV